MKKLFFAACLCLSAAASAQAQEPITDKPIPLTDKPIPLTHEASRVTSTGELTPTPEMWFYEQERRRWDDPETIVRANAMRKSAERRQRLATMAWYGVSNSRPHVSPDPTFGNFGPYGAANGYPASAVFTAPAPTVIIEADRGITRY